ncbi:MAG: phosphoribosylamine--glycine ligase [Planctomycetes bacterium]|nr:phosphoribosylamine--glycine ligase [Planctomycetota bacterium]MBU1518147.1 phosphoribosylamine--glycine ligase [Planctomycetota bacterium]MBU2457071.1 phosphoribosylamine--glycine ligase [Planctomycetota bacterium]
MNVLLLGNGGREHAIAWKLAQSRELKKLFIAPGNPGTAKCGVNVDIKADDYVQLLGFAKDNKVGLAVIGPEDPLAAGIVERFEKSGIKAFGPSGAAAQLEADKAFSKQIMKTNAIPTAESRTFDNFQDAKTYIASRDEAVVIKAAGLAKGKGVFVCDEPCEGIIAAEKIMERKIFGKAGEKIIVEDKLLGQEASILAFVDGRNIYVLESSQDHKAIGDGDTGPNTGGMGAYSPAPIVTDKLMDQITKEILVPTVDGMNRNGTPYKGILYAGIMITQGGPRVLEFNVRFGDPETQPILARLKSDLLEAMLATCDGTLDKITLEWDDRAAVCVVMASGGYPDDYEKGKVITGIEEAEAIKDVVVFHAGTAEKNGQIVTSGGRVLGVTALGDKIADAQAKAYEAAEKIKFEKAYYRKDIGDKAIKKSKI